MFVHTQLDNDGFDEIARTLGVLPTEAKKALSKTINDAAINAHAKGVKEITQQANIAESYVRSKLTINQRANLADPTAMISARLRGTGLRRFDAQQEVKTGKTRPLVNGGVSVQVKPSGGRKLLPHAFFITLNNGNVHIATRNKGANGKNDYTVRYGPSVSQMWQSVRDDVEPPLDELLDDFLAQLGRI